MIADLFFQRIPHPGEINARGERVAAERHDKQIEGLEPEAKQVLMSHSWTGNVRRLKNVGSCTWTTSYRLAFQSGEQMGAPSSMRLTISGGSAVLGGQLGRDATQDQH